MSNVVHLKNKRNNKKNNSGNKGPRSNNSDTRSNNRKNRQHRYKSHKKINNKKPSSSGKYLLIVALSLATLLALATRVFRVDYYEVEGNRLYSDREILSLLDIGSNANMMKVFMNAKKDLKAYPYIDYVEVEYLNYNKVRINVFEKQIIGYLLYMSEYLCVDKDGYIVDYVKPENLNDQIAIIEGISSDKLVLGEKINIPDDIINICYLLNKAEVKYDMGIDIIDFKNNRTEDIALRIKSTNIEFGSMNFFNEKIQSIKDILPQIPEGESGTLYLGKDGRTSYYKKNLE